MRVLGKFQIEGRFAIILVVIVIVFILLGLFFHSNVAGRNAKFHSECIAQGGQYVQFDNRRPACVIDSQTFYR